MKRIYFILFLALLVLFSQVHAQVSLGLEFQLYPTGVMPGGRVAWLLNENDELNLRIGANLFDHQDFGVQEEEIGGGWGFTPGYRRYSIFGLTHLFLGARVDFWRNINNWRNDIGLPTETSGTTRIVVVQPTAEAGYRLTLGEQVEINPSVSFGLEWNVISDGEDVGQGTILLLGVSIMYLP